VERASVSKNKRAAVLSFGSEKPREILGKQAEMAHAWRNFYFLLSTQTERKCFVKRACLFNTPMVEVSGVSPWK
jgi:hypothetical protein